MDVTQQAAQQFGADPAASTVAEFGSGNINRTFLVSSRQAGRAPFLLQRLNTHVFTRPELVMANIGVVTEHVRARVAAGGLADRPWEVPRVLRTATGADHWRGPDGSFWRGLSFIGKTHCVEVVTEPERAREVGFALGVFHTFLSDLAPERLADTLPGFHVTPGYLAQYDKVVAQRPRARSNPDERFCHEAVAAHRAAADGLERARADGRLAWRTIHGDPKVNNVLLDNASGRALAMIDLDTVKPGLVHYDIGDGLRSSCNRLGEETADWRAVRFDLDLAAAMLEGYCGVARRFLTAADFDLMPAAIALIAFELGLRFFTDHLAGDVYFKVSRPGHNLARALVQFQLHASIVAQEAALRALVDRLR